MIKQNNINENNSNNKKYRELRDKVLSKLKCRGFRATSLSTYDFSTLYTTLPHNLNFWI